jgi:hypothetical protein
MTTPVLPENRVATEYFLNTADVRYVFHDFDDGRRSLYFLRDVLDAFLPNIPTDMAELDIKQVFSQSAVKTVKVKLKKKVRSVRVIPLHVCLYLVAQSNHRLSDAINCFVFSQLRSLSPDKKAQPILTRLLDELTETLKLSQTVHDQVNAAKRMHYTAQEALRFYTIEAWTLENGTKLNVTELSDLADTARRYCLDNGVPVIMDNNKHTYPPRHAFPKSVLDEMFATRH